MEQRFSHLDAMGSASGHVLDIDGNLVTTEFDSRHLTMSAPQRICLGGGPQKIGSMAGMIRAHLANLLVTDELTAEALLKSFQAIL